MACDGDIDKREVALIKTLHQEKEIFGVIDIDQELDNLLLEINRDGLKFFKNFFNELAASELSIEDELKLIEVAIDTIKADEIVEYSEVKFFKVIRSKLKIDTELVLSIHPDFEEYMEQDILSQSYFASLQDDYFNIQILPQFELLSAIDKDNDDDE